MHRFLSALKPHIDAAARGNALLGFSAEQVFQQLLSERQDLMRTIPDQDLAWYRVFLLRYVLDDSQHPCRCNYTLLDNVDHLHPELQRQAVEFVLVLSEILQSRTVIAIRPLTWSRSVLGHILVRTQPHYSPNIDEVVWKRVKLALDEAALEPDTRKAVVSLVGTFLGKGRDPLLATLFRATAGLSVRFALRNLENMFESPILGHFPEGEDAASRMKISDLARAFFFGNRPSMIEWAFENLYRVGGDDRIEFRLLKARTLDLLIRVFRGTARTYDLCSYLARFGYQFEVIRQAVTELLLPQRPLIWSEEGFELENHISHARLVVTPIGRNYYERLFGEVYYDEVCMAHSFEETIGLRMVYDFHQQLAEEDLAEVKLFARELATPVVYRSLYPRSMPALSALHARRVLEGLKKRARRDDLFFDPNREDWIRRRVEVILAPAGFQGLARDPNAD